MKFLVHARDSEFKFQEDLPWSKPEEHDGVSFVYVRQYNDRKHYEEEKVAKYKVSGKESQFGDLAEIFSPGLGERVPSHIVPFPVPPGNVGGIGFELAGQSKGNDQLQYESLECNDRDHAKQRLREDKSLEEEHDLEEGEEHNDRYAVRNGSEDRAELLATHTEKGSHAASHSK